MAQFVSRNADPTVESQWKGAAQQDLNHNASAKTCHGVSDLGF